MNLFIFKITKKIKFLLQYLNFHLVKYYLINKVIQFHQTNLFQNLKFHSFFKKKLKLVFFFSNYIIAKDLKQEFIFSEVMNAPKQKLFFATIIFGMDRIF